MQRIFTYGDIQNTTITPVKKLNILEYKTDKMLSYRRETALQCAL